jgi:hypothetical protein
MCVIAPQHNADIRQFSSLYNTIDSLITQDFGDLMKVK